MTSLTRLQKDALIAEMAERLHEKGSWCGEIHLQKALYFLQELFEVPTRFNFILPVFVRRGPFRPGKNG